LLTTGDRHRLAEWLRAAASRGPLLSPAFRPAARALVIAGAGVTAGLGVLVAGQVRAGRLDAAADRWVQSGLAGHRGTLAGLGAPASVAVLTTVLVLACLAAGRLRVALLAAVAVPGAAVAAEVLIKPLVGQMRYTALSFPSGHVTSVSAVAAVLAVLLIGPSRPPLAAAPRVLVAAAGVLLTGGVAVAQIALGRHYFTDTVAGAATGVAVVLLAALIFDRLAGPAARSG
jgi:undecaprenyl-diphosphatase